MAPEAEGGAWGRGWRRACAPKYPWEQADEEEAGGSRTQTAEVTGYRGVITGKVQGGEKGKGG